MKYTIPKMPYAYDALEPYIDARTMEIHYTKHHQSYVDKLNAAVKEHSNLQKLTPEQLLKNLEEVPEDIRTAVRNQGGGDVNHTFFWPMLKKEVVARGPVVDAITKKFGSFDQFKEKFAQSATTLFGSGWAWLVINDGELEIMNTGNQDNPIIWHKKPILGIDVWEHAYYLKYQNRRAEYVSAFWNVVNWDKVNEYFEAARR